MEANLSVVAIVNCAALVNTVEFQVSLECSHSMGVPLTGVDMTGMCMDQVGQSEVAYTCNSESTHCDIANSHIR